MVAARAVQPTPNVAPIVAVIAVLAAVAAAWFRFPGAIVLLIGLTVASYFTSPPQLTGRKDATGYPAVGNPGEERKLRHHRAWSQLRWRLIVPNADWLFGDTADLPAIGRAQGLAKVLGYIMWLLVPTSFASLAAIGAAAVVYPLPTDAASGQLVWVNAAAGYVLVKQVDAVQRRYASIADPRPSVTVADLVRVSRKRGRNIIAAVAPPVLVGVVAGFGSVLAVVAFDLDWLITPVAVGGVGCGLVAAAAVGRRLCLPEALTDWTQTVDARAMWDTRWQVLKQEPAPYLLTHERFGPDGVVHADTFEAPATLASAGAIALLPKLTPVVGAGMRVTVLNVPDTDSTGQPIPGSKNPLRFKVVAVPVDVAVDASDPAVDADLLRLVVECAGANATIATGYPQLGLVSLDPVFVPGEETTAAFKTLWAAPDSPAEDLVASIAAQVGGAVGSEGIADPAEGAVIYIGALTAGTTAFADGGLSTRFDVLRREAEWARRWRDVLKLGEVQPYIQSNVYKTAELADGTELHVQPFMTAHGIHSSAYMVRAKEQALQPALDRAPFVAILGWAAKGPRSGGRDSGAFRVVWSHSPVPESPALVKPVRPGRSDVAQQWVLAAAVNQGFDAARLARPEVVSALALTKPDSREHIWDLSVRLYEGVTVAQVKLAAEKVRLGMGAAAWLRVTALEDGCRIVVGASPRSSRVTFASSKNEALCTALDWEQAFTDAKVIGTNGSTPTLIAAGVLPRNEKVQVLDFHLPPGTSRTLLREARGKLQPATGNVFIEDREAPGAGADTVRLLVCPEMPLPFPAPVMWDAVEDSSVIPFGSNVEGEPVEFDWREDPHLMLLGKSGTGKSAALTVLMAGAIMRNCDVYVSDPTKFAADFQFLEPWTKAMSRDIHTSSAMMSHVYEEVKRRRALNGKFGASSYRDLPADVMPRHIVVFIDEFTSLMIPETVPRLSGNETEDELREHAEFEAVNDAKKNIGAISGRLVREARSAGVTLVLAGQDLKKEVLDHIPGGGSLKNNMSAILLGNASSGAKMSALKSPFDTPDLGDTVPLGRGLFESSSSRPQIIQFWYDAPDHNGSLIEHIAGVRPPLSESDRVQLEQMVKPVGAQPVHGQIIEGDVSTYDRGLAPSADKVVDLGIASDFTIDFDDLFGEDDGVADLSEAGQSGAPRLAAALPSPGAPLDPEPTQVLEHGSHLLAPAYVPEDVVLHRFSEPADDDFIGVRSEKVIVLPHGGRTGAPGVGVVALADLDAPPFTGHTDIDRLVAWVRTHSEIRQLAWVGDAATAIDDIGIPVVDIARDAIASVSSAELRVFDTVSDAEAWLLAPDRVDAAHVVFDVPAAPAAQSTADLFADPVITVPPTNVTFD